MAIDQYSRVKHKRTIVSGATPTLGPSDDHTDGTWIDTDIYPGEFFLDMGGQVGWFGYSGISSGVGVWMSGDTSVGSVTAGEFLSSEQIGANIIISYTGTSEIFGGYVYNYYDFTIPAGVNIFNVDFYPPESFVGVTATEAHILFIDSVTYESYYAPLNNGLAGEPNRAAAWHYNGVNYDRLVGGGFLAEDATREQNSFAFLISINMFATGLANGGISFRVFSGAGFPPNDCKGRLIFKFRRTPI